MKKIIPALLLLAAIGLGGCANGKLPDLTATVTNPVTSVDIYRAKNAYAATVDLAVKWRRYCFGRPYASLMADPIAKRACTNRRATLRTIQSLDAKAFDALTTADTFVRTNPTISASTVVGLAWTAITKFQTAVPATP